MGVVEAAGFMTEAIEVEVAARKKMSGFQPISPIFLIACAACLGIACMNSTLAPDDFSLTIWLSMVGSVDS